MFVGICPLSRYMAAQRVRLSWASGLMQQESSIRSPRRRERATGAAVAGRVAVQFFGSRQTQIPSGLEQAILQDWHHVKFDQHRMPRLRESSRPSLLTT